MIDKNPPLKAIDILKLELWEEANVRKSDPYKELDDLSNNIKKNGLKNPLLVSGKTKDGIYRVFSGQRRLMACTNAGLKTVPCLVHENITLREARVLSLSENLYRLKMNYNDISDAAKTLLESFGNRKDVATALGVHENTVKRYLSYDDIPQDIKKLVGEKKISAKQAMDLYTKFPDQNKSIKIARELSRYSKRDEKRKYYYAIRDADPKATSTAIKTAAKKMKPFKKYTIELSPKDTQQIQRLATKKSQKDEEVIEEIIGIALQANNDGIIEL
ncbi:MAG: ParB/RepB/Spo0J family partition protein [Nitrosarchaeum sp.]|nr:MAG: ParB/RepB/Spo0J family partition protein [Nitrosarchaeum sp.]